MLAMLLLYKICAPTSLLTIGKPCQESSLIWASHCSLWWNGSLSMSLRIVRWWRVKLMLGDMMDRPRRAINACFDMLARWPSGLRRYVQVVVSQGARVRISLLSHLFCSSCGDQWVSAFDVGDGLMLYSRVFFSLDPYLGYIGSQIYHLRWDHGMSFQDPSLSLRLRFRSSRSFKKG